MKGVHPGKGECLIDKWDRRKAEARCDLGLSQLNQHWLTSLIQAHKLLPLHVERVLPSTHVFSRDMGGMGYPGPELALAL